MFIYLWLHSNFFLEYLLSRVGETTTFCRNDGSSPARRYNQLTAGRSCGLSSSSSCCSRRHARKQKSKHNTTAAQATDNTNATSITSTWYITKHKLLYRNKLLSSCLLLFLLRRCWLLQCCTRYSTIDSRQTTVFESSVFTQLATALYVSTL